MQIYCDGALVLSKTRASGDGPRAGGVLGPYGSKLRAAAGLVGSGAGAGSPGTDGLRSWLRDCVAGLNRPSSLSTPAAEPSPSQARLALASYAGDRWAASCMCPACLTIGVSNFSFIPTLNGYFPKYQRSTILLPTAAPSYS